VLSFISMMREGSMAETRTVGREGAVGLLANRGDYTMFQRSIVQVPGKMARIGLAELRRAIANSAALQDLLRRYSQTVIAQLMQAVACNALHPVEARLCRCLLASRDRSDSDVLPYTHEFLRDARRAASDGFAHCEAFAIGGAYTHSSWPNRNLRSPGARGVFLRMLQHDTPAV
jgi:hypothetical protein